MKKIYNIIDSELILRTNNHRLRQRNSKSESISDGTTTIFTTKAVIGEMRTLQ
jgi:rRNA-processing protein FCF1